MKTLLESEEFQAELPGWPLRGFLCAANSAIWAGLMGFQAPAEIAGMLAGVAFWVALFAGACAWSPSSTRWKQPEMVAALKWAAGIKIGLTAAGWVIFAVASAVRIEGVQQMAMLGMIDMLLGMAALSLVALLAGLADPGKVAAMDSFAWTGLTTVVEGALMAGVIVGIALLVWLCWRMFPVLRRRLPFSPVRHPD